MRRSVQIKGIAFLVLLMITLLIWFAVAAEDRRGHLTVSFLNIGQGDSIFIDSPSGRQILIDGGPNSSVLRELSAIMPWWDRSIDLVIGTHPDADHIGGLIDIFPRYDIGTIIQSSVLGSTAMWGTFEKGIREERAKVITAQRGQVIDLGKGAYLEILFPDRNVPNIETNVGCVISRVVYGATSFLLPCDTTVAVESYLTSIDGTQLHSTVLKVAHHGSKTSSSPLFLGFVNPEYGVFSRGCDNKYGHPSPETVQRFKDFDIPTFDTCTDGRITFVSDGVSVQRQ